MAQSGQTSQSQSLYQTLKAQFRNNKFRNCTGTIQIKHRQVKLELYITCNGSNRCIIWSNQSLTSLTTMCLYFGMPIVFIPFDKHNIDG